MGDKENPLRDRKLFLGIGAQKSGTTSLFYMLTEHPDIDAARKKETKFFVYDELYQKGPEFYLSEWFDTNSSKPMLDIDPGYLFYPAVPERIFETFGSGVKFIVVLRDPAKRAFSHYVMERFRRNEKLPFLEAIAAEPGRISSDAGILLHSYIARGMYAKQLERYYKFFPKENFKIFIFEDDLIDNRERTIKELCAFLGVDYLPEKLPIDQKLNPARKVKSNTLDTFVRGKVFNFEYMKRFPWYRRMSKSFRDSLHSYNTERNTERLSTELHDDLIASYFINDIEQLEAMLDRDLSRWYS